MASDVVGGGGGGLAGRSVSWNAAVRFAIVPVLLLVGLLPSATSATEPDAVFALSDFDQAGLEADVLALVEAGAVGSEPALYAASGSSWSVSGSLVDGELGLGSGDEAIVRVAVMGGGGVLRFNDAGSLSLGAYFGASGAGSDLTVWVQTAASTVSFVASDVKSAGGNYVNVNVPADARSVLSGIGSGDRFILALTRPATLALSDFDQAGLEADVLALVEAGAVGASRLCMRRRVRRGLFRVRWWTESSGWVRVMRRLFVWRSWAAARCCGSMMRARCRWARISGRLVLVLI